MPAAEDAPCPGQGRSRLAPAVPCLPELELGELRNARVFAGYAGWDAGQLAGEVGRGDWFVVPALPDDVLTGQGPNLWARVLRRQGVPLALLATMPLDPRHN